MIEAGGGISSLLARRRTDNAVESEIVAAAHSPKGEQALSLDDVANC